MFESLLMLAFATLVHLPNSIVDQFSSFLSHLSAAEQTILSINEITSFYDLDGFLQNMALPVDYSNGEEDPLTILNQNNYQSSGWQRTESCYTDDVTGAHPINMKDDSFPVTDIDRAIQNTNFNSSYGGCGPIAMMGVLDYFARFLNYDEIMESPISSIERIALAECVFSHSTTYDMSFFANGPATFMTTWDYSAAFNAVISDKDLTNIISSNETWTFFGNMYVDYIDRIIESINKGLPVTMMTTNLAGSGIFASHYTNIFGYEKWVGYDSQGLPITRCLLKARPNFYSGGENPDYASAYYCDARILNSPVMGLITYSISSSETISLEASDFSNYYVNGQGNGQYFFESKYSQIPIGNNMYTDTYRLRTSYIENQYLVMSPKREGAGEAKLVFYMPYAVNYFEFDAGIWGNNEDIMNERFMIRIIDSYGLRSYIEYDLSTFNLKENMKKYIVLFPKNTVRIEFYATHYYPSGNQNRGRITLENLHFYLA